MNINKHPLTSIELLASNLKLDPYQHPAWQILHVQGEPFTGLVEGVDTGPAQCIVSAPGVRQEFQFGKCKVRVSYIDPDSDTGFALRKKFKDKFLFQEWSELGLNVVPPVKKSELIRALKNQMPKKVNGANIDERVRHVAWYIRMKHELGIDYDELARMSHLSKSRLSKLFRQETGTSISKFILWTRLRAALGLLLSGRARTISEAAMRTGFYDGPSFSRYAKSMLGTTPRFLKENARLIQE